MKDFNLEIGFCLPPATEVKLPGLHNPEERKERCPTTISMPKPGADLQYGALIQSLLCPSW